MDRPLEELGLSCPADWASYVLPNALMRDHGLVCVGAGEQVCVRRGFARRRLENSAVVFVSRGSGTFIAADGGRHPVEAPAVISVPAGWLHGYGPGAGGWTEHWMMFDGAMVQGLTGIGVLRPASAVLPLRRLPDELGALFGELRQALEPSALHSSFRASVLCQRLLAIAAAEALDAGSGPADRIIAALRESASEDGSLAQRAHRLGITVTELRSSVRAATGMAPHEFVVTTRIERAASMLAGTDLPVHAIGAAVGYRDPAFFSRLFARKTGLAPTVFRAQHSRTNAVNAGPGGR